MFVVILSRCLCFLTLSVVALWVFSTFPLFCLFVVIILTLSYLKFFGGHFMSAVFLNSLLFNCSHDAPHYNYLMDFLISNSNIKLGPARAGLKDKL